MLINADIMTGAIAFLFYIRQ
ncbi:hypothetical protein VCHENC02_3344A, partial [Vibrio harveyi]